MVGQFSLVILQWQWLFDMMINHDQPLIILGTLIRQSHFSKVGIPRRIFVILMEKTRSLCPILDAWSLTLLNPQLLR